MADEKKPTQEGKYLTIGVAIGVAIGAAMDDIPIGICIGVALGASYDGYVKNKHKENK